MDEKTYLVVNGDDFGVNHAINAGIIKAFTEGILTTASIITPTSWFDEAVALAEEYGLPLGVELAISCEYDIYRFGPLTGAPELSPDGKGYSFPKSPDAILPQHAEQVTREAIAQVDRLIDAGIHPLYFQSHMGGIPRWDGAFRDTRRTLAEKYAVPFKAGRGTPSDAPLRIEIDRSFGLTKPLDFEERKQWLLDALEDLQPGLHWLGSHPAMDTEEMRSMRIDSQWGAQSRYNDVRVMCDPDIRRHAETLGIQLIDAGKAGEMCRE